jgi:hypothetical protein
LPAEKIVTRMMDEAVALMQKGTQLQR